MKLNTSSNRIMEQDKIFFGEQGLSATSADFVANLAKEMLRKDESKIAGINFVCEQISALNNPTKSELSVGMEEAEVREIPIIMERIVRLKSLIAWLREAIKAKNRMLEEIQKKSFNGHWEELGMGEFPKLPQEEKVLTKDEYIASLSIADRSKMYSLQTKAAVLGKILHKDGAFETARERLYGIKSRPREMDDSRVTNIIRYYEPSVDSDIVDEVYFKLSAEHREAQAGLNTYLHDMENAIKQSEIDEEARVLKEQKEYSVRASMFYAKVREWKAKESKRIGQLKIIIPNSLRDIYEEVQKVGK